MTDKEFFILDEIVLSEDSLSGGEQPKSLEEWGEKIPSEPALWAKVRGMKTPDALNSIKTLSGRGFLKTKKSEDEHHPPEVFLTEKGLTAWKEQRRSRHLILFEDPNKKQQTENKTEMKKEPKDMTSSELVEAYNSLSKTPVKKFSDRATGIKRVTALFKERDKLKEAIKKKPSIKVVKEKKPKSESKSAQKYSLKEGYTLHKVEKMNPRREGTHGHASWEALRSGMTYLEAIDAGARNRDLRWDILHGRIEIRDKSGKAVQIEKVKP